MNRRLLLISAALLVTRSGRSDAIIVECANCSSFVEQLISDAKQAAQYATQLQQKALQLQQYANMVQNTVALPQMIWSQAQADIGTVRGLVNAASVLTGNSGTIMSRLSSAQGYATTAAMTPQQITNQFNQWQQTISNASNSFGRTVGLQQSQMSNYAAMQAAINLHAQTATGQVQVLQAGVEMSSLSATQLNQMQATLTAAATEQTTRDMVAADRQAMEDQDLVNFLAPPPLPVSGNPAYGPNTLQ